MKLIFILLFSVNSYAQNLYKLEIFKPDASLYWSETFNTEEEKDKWLASEMTRPYWNELFTTSVTLIDNSIKPAVKSAIDVIKYDMACGKNIYANIRLLNDGKSKAVRDAMRATFSPIRDALLDGDLCSAKVDIAAITPDANITAENKTAIDGMINDCKVCL